MIKGITIELLKQVQTGTDWSNRPIYEDQPEEVHNVLVGEGNFSESDDITQSLDLHGKHIAYTLAIPKGDDHVWTDAKVRLPAPFEGVYQVIGFPTAGIEANIPLKWNKRVRIERYVESNS